MRRLRIAGVLAGFAISAAALLPSPVAAATVATGDASFTGTASLPTFPCPSPPPFGTGPCNGSFSGSWSGNLSGVAGTSPFDVTWSTSGSGVSASFLYAEWQCAAGTETVLGIAQGSGTATAGPGQLQGKWQVPGEPFARDITAVSLSFTFAWTRLATSSVLVLNTSTLTLTVSGIGTVTVLTGQQVGVAAFAPTSSSGVSGVPSCANPLTNVSGDIAGDIPLAGTM